MVPLVPRAPSSVSLQNSVVSSNPAISISWTKPPSDRTILHYEVQYKINTTSTWSVLSLNISTTSATLKTVQLGSAYEIRVRAVSDLGSGVWSEVANIVTINSKC